MWQLSIIVESEAIRFLSTPLGLFSKSFPFGPEIWKKKRRRTAIFSVKGCINDWLHIQKISLQKTHFWQKHLNEDLVRRIHAGSFTELRIWKLTKENYLTFFACSAFQNIQAYGKKWTIIPNEGYLKYRTVNSNSDRKIQTRNFREACGGISRYLYMKNFFVIFSQSEIHFRRSKDKDLSCILETKSLPEVKR